MKNPATANLIPGKTGDCIRIPRAAFGARRGGRPFTLSSILLQGAVYSFGSERDGKQREYVMTYSEWEKRTGISDTTFWRSKTQLKAAGRIDSAAQSKYTYKKDASDSGLFLRLECWTLTTSFTLKAKKGAKEETRRLTLAEAIVFSYLFTYCDNKNRKNKTLTRSYRAIAEDLNLSEKTVRSAIYTLMRAELVFRGKEDKGDATGRASTYHVNARLLNRHKAEKSGKKQEKPRELTKGEIEGYYSELRHTAEDRAERSLARALRDKKFASLYNEEKALGVKIAFTELERPLEAFAMQNRLNEIQRLKNERLKELGLEIKPRYRCAICGDTGYDSGGKPCSCLKKLLEEGVIEL